MIHFLILALLYLALDKSFCVASGSDPLPNGNGKGLAADRVGSLGGVVDDFYQDYKSWTLGGGWVTSLSHKPDGSMTTEQVIAKYGPIDTWDTSRVMRLDFVFTRKKNINPDIRKWNVEGVWDMRYMFDRTNAFNIDLSSWIVSSVTNMNNMFYQATAYTQELCGITWVESTASQIQMFMDAGSGAKIGTEPCAKIKFVVDMNGVDQPSAEYALVTINGAWNGWNGWGWELFDGDGDGVWTGTMDIKPGTTFEYVVAVSGEADGYSGWGLQWGDGCANANVIVTAGDAGSVTTSTLTPGCAEVLGCMDVNATDYDAAATAQTYDQYGNLGCIYASCDDVPEYGCIYVDGFRAFNAEFDAALCVTYGGTPCEAPTTGVAGCMDVNAIDYDITATEQAYNQYGILSCIYASCEDIPDVEGCIYADSYASFYQGFGPVECANYGGTPCEEPVAAEVLTMITTVCDAASSVAMTGPWGGWDPAAGPVASDNGDGSWTFTFDPAPTDNMEYLLVVDGVQEDLVASSTASEDWSCTPLTDYWSYANRQWVVGSGDVSNTYGTCGGCEVESTTATIEFVVDMNGVDQPSAEYALVTVNGGWNGWNRWGAELFDVDGDGVYTGSLEIQQGTTFEYVVAVSGEADGYSGWGLQWGDGCVNANVIVTAGDAGSVTTSTLTPGCAEVLGCIDENGQNYDATATAAGTDQYGNSVCIYASCDDVPEHGCIYVDGFRAFNAEFDAALCVTYGGTPCGKTCANSGTQGGAFDCAGSTNSIHASPASVTCDSQTDGCTASECCTAVPSTLTITTTVCSSATEVRMTGPLWGWVPQAGPVAADNGDGTWTFTFDPAPTADMEYLLVVDGVQEDLVAANTASDDWSCTPITDNSNYANREWTVGSGNVENTYGTCGNCGTDPPDDPLPNGNGKYLAADRVGSLGGVVDDFYQDYKSLTSAGGWVTSLSHKPAGSMSTAEVIAKYGPIDTWDTSQVTNMKYVFNRKKDINPDIRKWNVERVFSMFSMFRETDSFNIDLSGWIVSSVEGMDFMFRDATAYTQVLCGNTWIESAATKMLMFAGAGTGAKIGSEPCPSVTFQVKMTVCEAATSVSMTGPWWGWDPQAGPVAVDNGDDTWTFTFDPAPTANMEYLLVVDGVQENLVAANTASEDWSCTPITDSFSYANRQWVVGSEDVVNTYGTCGNCGTDPPDDPALTITTTVCETASDVRIVGPWWGWDTQAGPVAVDSGDNTWTFTFDPAPKMNMEYKLLVDGVQENLIGKGGCAPITDDSTHANRKWIVGSGNVVNTYGTCGNCDDLVDTPARIPRPKLDDKWHLQIECIDGLQNCWANGEKQHYTDRLENAYVSGGHLHIVAKKEEEYVSQGVKRSYTSARLNSKYDFKYGTVKVRAKLPKKSGLWPAIWTLGSNINEVGVYDFGRSPEVPWRNAGEIDIMEQYGTQNFVGSAMHGPLPVVITNAAGGNAHPWNTAKLSPSVDDFHVYSMEWTDAGITFKVDDVAYKTVTAPTDKTNWPFDHKHFLLLNVAVEGITHKTGAIAGDFVSGEMVVDYVRIYGENGDLNWSDEFGISVSDCPGLKEAFQANCDCGVEYTSFVSLASVVPASDCSGLKKAYKENCDCSQ